MKQFCVLMKYSFRKRFDECYPGSSLREAIICKWFAKFDIDDMITENNAVEVQERLNIE